MLIDRVTTTVKVAHARDEGQGRVSAGLSALRAAAEKGREEGDLDDERRMEKEWDYDIDTGEGWSL